MKERKEHPHLSPLPSRERRLGIRERRLGKGIRERKLCEKIGGGGITPSPWSSPVKGEETRKGSC